MAPANRRYQLVEADGKKLTAYYDTFVQRPAALERARRLGMGVWDQKEEEMLVEYDAERRLRSTLAVAEKAYREAGAADALASRIRRVNGIENPS